MTHPNEEELIAYHGGEVFRRDAIAEHLANCPECRVEFERIDAVLAALGALPVPDPDVSFDFEICCRLLAVPIVFKIVLNCLPFVE